MPRITLLPIKHFADSVVRWIWCTPGAACSGKTNWKQARCCAASSSATA
jgi:hypothetical protein